MSKQRKISIRKVIQTICTLLLVVGCVVATLSASKIQRAEKLKGVYLHVKNERECQFLDKEKLMKVLKKNNHLQPHITKLNTINLKKIEQQIYRDPWVAEAQVYIDNQKNMHVYVTQQEPSARVFFENGQSYYLNDSLALLPTSEKFSYYTTVVTNVPWFNNDSINRVARASVLSMAHAIDKDSFWSAQIEQISMTPDLEFELYPVLGAHKILFGDTVRAERKLENLLAFYKNILNKIGWDKYDVLDVRFKDQVVASPALAWKMPAKGFISNMDWVKTIIGDETNNSDAKVGKISMPTTTTSKHINSATTNTNTIAVPKTISPKTVATSKPSSSIQPNHKKPPNVKSVTSTKPSSEKKTNTIPATKTKATNQQPNEQSPKPKYILNN